MTSYDAAKNEDGTFLAAVNAAGQFEYAVRIDDVVTEEIAREIVNDHINEAAGYGYPGAGRWVIRTLCMLQFNKLSAAEAERLALLSEELGEVQQAIGKILRHGYQSHHPDGGPNNRENLEKELGHVHHAVTLMAGNGDIDLERVVAHQVEKLKSVRKYLHHQGLEG